MADETRKAASVAQLQELSKSLTARMDQQSGAAAGVELAALRSLVEQMAAKLLSLESGVQQCMTMCETMGTKIDEPDAPPDFSPVIAVVKQMLDQHATAMKELLTAMVSAVTRPVSKTGEATLPNGQRITLQVSEARM